MRLRRPAFGDVEFSGHIFPVTYKAVDRELPQLLAKHRPQALLMFGLASRTRACPGRDPRPQRRHHAVARRRADPRAQGLDRGRRRCHDVRPAHRKAAARGASRTGIDARASRDAGSLSLQLSELARDRGRRHRRRSSPRRVRAHPAARARRRIARKGVSAHHAGRTGRCRRSDAAGDGEGWREGDRARRGERSESIARPVRWVRSLYHLRSRYANINPTPNNRRVPPARSPCFAAFLRYVESIDTSARKYGHGRQPPPSDRSFRRRRRRARWRCRRMLRARRR